MAAMNTVPMVGDYTAETARLGLRVLQESDLGDFHAIWSNPNATQWTSFGICHTPGNSKVWLDILLSPSPGKPEPQNYGVFLKKSLPCTSSLGFSRVEAWSAGLPRSLYLRNGCELDDPETLVSYQPSESSEDQSTGRYTPEPDTPMVRYSPEPSIYRPALGLYYDQEREIQKVREPWDPPPQTGNKPIDSAFYLPNREILRDFTGTENPTLVGDFSKNNIPSPVVVGVPFTGTLASPLAQPRGNPSTKTANCPPTTVSSDNTNSRNQMIGIVGFFRSTSEVGYIFNEEFWGQGYASEALAAFLDIQWGRVKLDPTIPPTIHARVDPDNPASVKVLEKCGFSVVRRIPGNKSLNTKDTLFLKVERGE